MHEDISIKTNNWGSTVLAIFEQNKTVGLIGVAGSSYKALTPSAWIGKECEGTVYMNILQGFKHTGADTKLLYDNPRDEKLAKVACVDGVWFCTTHEVLNKVSFDELTFKGFHAYDIDFSMAVRQHYDVVVTYDVLLHHYSEGNFNVEWFLDILKLHEKWSSYLPAVAGPISQQRRELIEKISFRTFVDYMVRAKLPMAYAYKVLWRHNRYLKLYPSLFFKMHNFIRKAYAVARKEGRL